MNDVSAHISSRLDIQAWGGLSAVAGSWLYFG